MACTCFLAFTKPDYNNLFTLIKFSKNLILQLTHTQTQTHTHNATKINIYHKYSCAILSKSMILKSL